MPLLTRANAVLVQQIVTHRPFTATIVRGSRARTITIYAHSWGGVYNLAQHLSHPELLRHDTALLRDIAAGRAAAAE